MTVLQLGPYPPPHGGVQTNLAGIHNFLRSQGIKGTVINLTRFRRSPAEGVYYPRSAFQVIVLLLRLRSDIIHLHIGGNVTARLLGLCLFCSLLPRARTVLTLHSGGYPSSPEGRRARPRTFRGFVFRRLDRIIAVNPAIANLFYRYGVSQDRVRLICPHVAQPEPGEVALPEIMKRFFETHRPVLLSVGGLEPEYDIPLQIEALGVIRNRFPEAGLVLIGSGSLEAEINARIQSAGYGDHVLSCGDVPHSITLRAMAESNVLLRTTLYDGDSIAVREALDLGTPVVATDNGMRPDGVYLTPAQDAGKLSASVETVIAGPRLPDRPIAVGQGSLAPLLQLYEDLAGEMISPSLFTRLQVGILRRLAPPVPLPLSTVYDGKSKLAATFGDDFLSMIGGLTVMDVGCGNGLEVIEMAKAGAKMVLGVDIDQDLLSTAVRNAVQAGVSDRCRFLSSPEGVADLAVSLDCFEHYSDPALVFRTVYGALRPGGAFHISFGWPWFHPRGVHLLELPPWTHVFFSEEAIVRWRQLMRGGSATTYAEIGLNQMTISRFERLVRHSGFNIDSFQVVPIRPLRWFHNRFTREFTTSVVRCVLRKPMQ